MESSYLRLDGHDWAAAPHGISMRQPLLRQIYRSSGPRIKSMEQHHMYKNAICLGLVAMTLASCGTGRAIRDENFATVRCAQEVGVQGPIKFQRIETSRTTSTLTWDPATQISEAQKVEVARCVQEKMAN